MTSDLAQQALLDHLFLNVAWPNFGDAAGLQPSAAPGNLYIALHTAAPTSQATFEATYTGYARVAVPRSGAGWTRTLQQVRNAALVTFPICTAGASLVTHVTIGTVIAGAGQVITTQALAAAVPVTAGITPQLAIGALVAGLGQSTDLGPENLAAIALAVWDELRAAHVVAGSFGEAVKRTDAMATLLPVWA